VRQGEKWGYADGDLALTGELFRPRGEDRGRAVVVFHEADGIGGNVRRYASKLADLGYLAAAADMHGRGRPLEGDEIAPALAEFMNDRALLRRRALAAVEALREEAGLDTRRIAAVGYCFGGTTALELARAGTPLAAAVSHHGILTTPAPACVGAIPARILACTGARDPLVPPEDVAAFQEEMAEAEADWQLCVFGRAMHSFTNVAVDDLGDPRMAYDAQAAETAWMLMQLFLERSFDLAERAA
jgi:dienelactone hydrolase